MNGHCKSVEWVAPRSQGGEQAERSSPPALSYRRQPFCPPVEDHCSVSDLQYTLPVSLQFSAISYCIRTDIYQTSHKQLSMLSFINQCIRAEDAYTSCLGYEEHIPSQTSDWNEVLSKTFQAAFSPLFEAMFSSFRFPHPGGKTTDNLSYLSPASFYKYW